MKLASLTSLSSRTEIMNIETENSKHRTGAREIIGERERLSSSSKSPSYVRQVNKDHTQAIQLGLTADSSILAKK